ncbi:MAG TPA: hypothetical protein V6C52_07925 [Coleofasciculaceae cyanobacterium]
MMPACRRLNRGNALIEYVIPLAVLLVAVGILATIFDINAVIGEYFMAASGHTQSALQGGSFKTKPMSSTAIGAFSNGNKGFTASFVALANGQGATITADGPPPATTPAILPSFGESVGIYSGPVMRTSGRVDVAAQTAGERLFLFDNERSGAIRPAPPAVQGAILTPPAAPTTTTVTDPLTGVTTTTTSDPATGVTTIASTDPLTGILTTTTITTDPLTGATTSTTTTTPAATTAPTTTPTDPLATTAPATTTP